MPTGTAKDPTTGLYNGCPAPRTCFVPVLINGTGVVPGRRGTEVDHDDAPTRRRSRSSSTTNNARGPGSEEPGPRREVGARAGEDACRYWELKTAQATVDPRPMSGVSIASRCSIAGASYGSGSSQLGAHCVAVEVARRRGRAPTGASILIALVDAGRLVRARGRGIGHVCPPDQGRRYHGIQPLTRLRAGAVRTASGEQAELGGLTRASRRDRARAQPQPTGADVPVVHLAAADRRRGAEAHRQPTRGLVAEHGGPVVGVRRDVDAVAGLHDVAACGGSSGAPFSGHAKYETSRR